MYLKLKRLTRRKLKSFRIFITIAHNLLCLSIKRNYILKYYEHKSKNKKRREELNYTQEYMADELGISQPAYARMEKGNTKINIERLLQISKILQVDPQEFLESEKNINQFNNNHAYGFVENLYHENKGIYEKLIANLENEIRQLKEDNKRLYRKLEG